MLCLNISLGTAILTSCVHRAGSSVGTETLPHVANRTQFESLDTL